ncbi:hypothetical protein I545_0486 [Mycobacterium kansasii 662]|uniref:Uncharacterized protein n=2 Tax=Mycobacterium kansasii TaxID=1768 RepID=A0A1V3XSF3_MYCKA|nr:hypothetical protein I545_0486 [Mycobacterium kansasii 662]KEP43447.1 hypothetical protein MKSMC1_14150 [Mycobacterium kansasii]OOK82157.1 hypothetical protein BZL30_1411 [Mycobacterium kansasii]OOK83570.1 hypothetical protein BZL29_0543 [Mycobacterium kansasii]
MRSTPTPAVLLPGVGVIGPLHRLFERRACGGGEPVVRRLGMATD